MCIFADSKMCDVLISGIDAITSAKEGALFDWLLIRRQQLWFQEAVVFEALRYLHVQVTNLVFYSLLHALNELDL